MKLKQLFNYRKQCKEQEEEIRKLKEIIIKLENQVVRVNENAQRYYDMLMDNLNKED